MSEGFTTVGPLIYPATDDEHIISIDPAYPHNFVGVIPCDETGSKENGATGEATVLVQTLTTPGTWQETTNGVIDLSAPADVSFAANAVKVLVSVSGVVDATHIAIMVAQNKA